MFSWLKMQYVVPAVKMNKYMKTLKIFFALWEVHFPIEARETLGPNISK